MEGDWFLIFVAGVRDKVYGSKFLEVSSIRFITILNYNVFYVKLP